MLPQARHSHFLAIGNSHLNMISLFRYNHKLCIAAQVLRNAIFNLSYAWDMTQKLTVKNSWNNLFKANCVNDIDENLPLSQVRELLLEQLETRNENKARTIESALPLSEIKALLDNANHSDIPIETVADWIDVDHSDPGYRCISPETR